MVKYLINTIPRDLKGLSFLLSVIMLFTSMSVFAIDLSDFKWQQRPLLLFAPDYKDMRLLQTQSHLQQKNCDLNDRDMIIGLIVAQGQSSLDKQKISAEDASYLRRQYGISSDQFVTLLIGKDGGEKFRGYHIPDLDEIFALIDGMPMRQDEIQEHSADCHSNHYEIR